MSAAITDPMSRSESTKRDAGSAPLKVVIIGLGSAALYVVSQYACRSIFYNGFETDFRAEDAGGYPYDASRSIFQYSAYWSANLGLFGLFIWLLLLARCGCLDKRTPRLLALAFPIAFGVGLLFCRPYLSTDAYSYAADGHIGSQPDGNPFLVDNASASEMEISAQLAEGGWGPHHGPTPYGPLWTRVAIAGMRAAGQNVIVAIYAYKFLALLAFFATGILIWLTLGHVNPHRQMAGTVSFLWNPLVIVEFVAEGHNDALMVAFVVGGLTMCAFSRPTTSMVAMAMAVLTKYLPAIFGPAQIAYLWRTRIDTPQFFVRCATATMIALSIAVLSYGRLWAGGATFAGVHEARTPWESASLPGGLHYAATVVMPESGFPALIPRILSILFFVVVLATAWRVRDIDSLFRSCLYVALAYTYLVNLRFWPWYVCLPLAIMALLPTVRFMWLAIVISLCGRLVAPLVLLESRGVISWKYAYGVLTAVGSTVPALIIFAVLIRAWFHARQIVPERSEQEPTDVLL